MIIKIYIKIDRLKGRKNENKNKKIKVQVSGTGEIKREREKERQGYEDGVVRKNIVELCA